jgi:SAM-dependent methyltransferase
MKAALRSALMSMGFFRGEQALRQGRRADPPADLPMADESGVPIPDADLIMLVAGHGDWRQFLSGGEATLAQLCQVLSRNGIRIERLGRILDFGCGCGRLIRHLPTVTRARLFGVDYNSKLVEWCQANLRGRFTPNNLLPPLGFKDAAFDLVYAFSVLTHLRQDTQLIWLAELRRVLRPGGHLLVTVHDEDHPACAHVRDKVLASGFHAIEVTGDALEGSNLLGAFQTRDYVRREFARFFDVIDMVPGRDPIDQTIVLLRKPL